jgi:molecular chaperone DnaK (HSP70)
MRVGIDFGTTHTVAAVVDRGNYPIVSFDGVDAWPSIIAANAAGELRFGLDAAAVRREPGWAVLRSFKRLLNDAGPRTSVALGGRNYLLADLLTGFLAQLESDLHHRSNADFAPDESVETAISVPANASSAQRFLTLDAFTAAGFRVVALLNKPSAAGFEYAHRYRATITAKREYVLVYDLGGGTFDASLLKMTGRLNEVIASEGIQRLCGDDFDAAILKLVRQGSGLGRVDATTLDLLREECAVRKEAVGPQTRRFLQSLRRRPGRETHRSEAPPRKPTLPLPPGKAGANTRHPLTIADRPSATQSMSAGISFMLCTRAYRHSPWLPSAFTARTHRFAACAFTPSSSS